MMFGFFNSASLPESAKCLIEAFRTGKVINHDLNPLGISEITVESPLGRVTASWYFKDYPRNLKLEDGKYPAESAVGRLIIKAAAKRAATILHERLASLDSRARAQS